MSAQSWGIRDDGKGLLLKVYTFTAKVVQGACPNGAWVSSEEVSRDRYQRATSTYMLNVPANENSAQRVLDCLETYFRENPPPEYGYAYSTTSPHAFNEIVSVQARNSQLSEMPDFSVEDGEHIEVHVNVVYDMNCCGPPCMGEGCCCTIL
jgi:hypothetical protein